jgi:Fe-S oxidoreductase
VRRCSDNCPAFTTGKILSPKHFTLDLRDHLYDRQEEFLDVEGARATIDRPAAREDEKAAEGETKETETKEAETTAADGASSGAAKHEPVNLVPNVIHEDVLWACTTCRACEEQCPVLISYVDKIVDMRRNLVQIGEAFPAELNKPFEGMG